MTKYDLFSEYYSENELPMITVNSLNEIVDFNEKSFRYVGYGDMGEQIELRPLVDSKQKSFPYTAVLVLKDAEYLSCVCLANPPSKEFRHIYFSDMAGNSADAMLASRFIIEQKFSELHSGRPLAFDTDSPLKKLQRLMMLLGANAGDAVHRENKTDVDTIVRYTVEKYKKRFPRCDGMMLDFNCLADNIYMSDNIISAVVSAALLGITLSSGRARLQIKETVACYILELVLEEKKFIADISKCGFSGMFLSRISDLNYWNTEIMYNAVKKETTIKIFISKTNEVHRFSSQTPYFDAELYAEILTDAMTM